MKIFGFIILFAVAICGQTNVNITTGSGAGKYRGQQIVDVWADPNSSEMIFDKWIGDTHLLQDPFEWTTKLKTGTKNINLTATFKKVPAWMPSEREKIGTTEMRYHFPSNVNGVVLHFHGSGGSADGLFNNVESIYYARDLVAAGFAVVALDSVDRIDRQWNTTNNLSNPDVQNVQAAINEFISRGLITNDTPVFASGISNGGGFAPRVSLLLELDANVIFIATGSVALMTLTEVPTVWAIMQNDTVLNAGSIERATNNFNNLRSRGIPAQLNILRPTPVYPSRFWRISGISQAESIEIYNALKSNGFLDARNYLKENPQFSNWQSVIPTKFTPFLNSLKNQLWNCYTEHTFLSNYNRRIINFLNSVG